MNDKEFELWNNQMAQKYNPDSFITESGTVIRFVERRRLQRTAWECNRLRPKRILDMGCGAGNLLGLLKGEEIVGIDLSDFLIHKATLRHKDKPHIKIQKGNIEDLHFPDDWFDFIICSEVLEHVRDPKIVLTEIHRLLKPNQYMVVTVPNENLINQTKKWVLKFGLKKWVAGKYAMSNNMMEEWHRTEVEKEYLFDACKNNFNLKKVIPIPFSWLPYHHIYVFQNGKSAH